MRKSISRGSNRINVAIYYRYVYIDLSRGTHLSPLKRSKLISFFRKISIFLRSRVASSCDLLHHDIPLTLSAKCTARTSKVARIITRFPERCGGGVFLSHFEVPSLLRVRGGGSNQRRQFVTFYEISTSAVVEFIKLARRMREREPGLGCWLFPHFFLNILFTSSGVEIDWRSRKEILRVY